MEQPNHQLWRKHPARSDPVGQALARAGCWLATSTRRTSALEIHQRIFRVMSEMSTAEAVTHVDESPCRRRLQCARAPRRDWGSSLSHHLPMVSHRTPTSPAISAHHQEDATGRAGGTRVPGATRTAHVPRATAAEMLDELARS